MYPFFRTCAVAGAVAWLVACGGGGGDAAPATPDGGAPPAEMALAAAGSSASTVSLAWAAVPQATGYVVQRRQGSGAWETVAELPAGSTGHVDGGLAPHTAYQYRVQALGAGGFAEQQATTTDDAAVTTPAGVVGAELARATVDAAGGRVASAEAGIRIEVPPGAFSAPTDVVLRRQSSTAPGATGEGVQVETGAAPQRPLLAELDYGTAPGGDGIVVAARQPDGSWLMLPTRSRDRAAGRIGVTLPATRGAAQRSAQAAVTAVDLARVQAMYLAPESDQLPVGQSLRLEPWVRVLVEHDDCPLSDPVCLPIPPVPNQKPLLEPRRLPFLNSKAGYTRQWQVQGLPGGSATFGTVRADGDVGAVYTAPQRKPSPNPVRVSFRSRHDASGREVELASRIEVMEPVWTGTIDGALDGTADLGFLMSAEGVWTVQSVDDLLQSFTATGTQSLHVVNVTCTGTASPSSAPLPAGLLKVDLSTDPATYKLDVGSLWNTTITGHCPDGSGTAPMVVPGQLVVEGVLTESNTRIQGRVHMNNISWQWNLKVRF